MTAKILKIMLVTLILAYATPVAYASETTGTLNTGIQTGIEGMVIVEPAANPVAGSYSGTQNVTLTGGAGTQSIHYTTDGTNPTCSTGMVYSSSITVSSSLTIKAVACYPQDNASSIASFDYTITSHSSGGGGGGHHGGGGGGGGPICTADADFNDNGRVDIFDLNILSNNFGSTTATETTGDTDCDGDVDIFDLNRLTTDWTG